MMLMIMMRMHGKFFVCLVSIYEVMSINHSHFPIVVRFHPADVEALYIIGLAMAFCLLWRKFHSCLRFQFHLAGNNQETRH